MVLSNGEFGDRLADEAKRQGLPHRVLRFPWGEDWKRSQIRAAADQLPEGGWIWAVHHETSTGALNPLAPLKELCRERKLRLCLDVVSSVGAVPLDLREVALASGTSGKGLGSFPGLALVFYSTLPSPQPETIPSYLDLGHWAANDGVPFTHSSNLVAALAVAVAEATPKRREEIKAKARWLREALAESDWAALMSSPAACDAVFTLVPPDGLSARAVGEEMERRGFALSYRSRHLLERNWLQISLLGNPPQAGLEACVHELKGTRAALDQANQPDPRLAITRPFPNIHSLAPVLDA